MNIVNKRVLSRTKRETYSEEDLRKAFVRGALTDLFNTWSISKEDMANEKFEEWFNEFKQQQHGTE